MAEAAPIQPSSTVGQTSGDKNRSGRLRTGLWPGASPNRIARAATYRLAAIIIATHFIVSANTAGAVAHGETASEGEVGEPTAEVDSSAVGVDSSSGAATLSIPVDLPPGPNDFKPNLALSYSSQRGNGLIGVGWSIELPMISCSLRFGVPNYTDCDPYELSGQVLVEHDENGVLDYHTFDESFSRIRRNEAQNQWDVTSTSGTVMMFGEQSGNSPTRVEGPGGTAEWHLSSTTDVFGNRITYEYSTGSGSDEGYLYPERISYANGTREVTFHYEPRPDATVDYKGGVRRARSERLEEIRVKVNGDIHHRLILRYETSGSSTISRLVSVQRFGSDCAPGGENDPIDTGNCSSLPAAEFEYHDSSEHSYAERRISSDSPSPSDPNELIPWYAPPGAEFPSGDQRLWTMNTQMADINGDGLVDLIRDSGGSAFMQALNLPESDEDLPHLGSPEVLINNGNGWDEPNWGGGDPNASRYWTELLRGLRLKLVSHRVKTVSSDPTTPTEPFVIEAGTWDESTPVFGTCVDPGESLPTPIHVENAGSVEFTEANASGGAPFFQATEGRTDYDPQQGYGNADWTDPQWSEIRVFPNFHFVDINADGFSDLVMSVHLTGFYLSFADCTNPQGPIGADTWIPGGDTSVVFMNTGDGWSAPDYADDDTDGIIADTLPPFGIVAFESGDVAWKMMGTAETPFAHARRNDEYNSPCDDYGLAGMRSITGPDVEFEEGITYSPDFCVTTYDLAPVFQDMNADGYPDLIVTRTANEDALFHGFIETVYGPGGWNGPVGFRESTTESVVWLQNPNPGPTEPQDRWIRAPAYDPPYDHSLVLQLPMSRPHNLVHQIKAGHENVENVDKGFRFVDFNNDGLTDIMMSPEGAGLGEFSNDSGGVFLNRGTMGDPYSAPKHSAWCSSSAVSGVDACAADASRYESPFWFAKFDISSHYQSGPDNRSMVLTHTTAPLQTHRPISFVDLNGDGWIDVLEHGASTGYSNAAWIHHPGNSGSVWVKDEGFGYSFGAPGGIVIFPDGTSQGYAVADVNADGVADLVASHRGSNVGSASSLISQTPAAGSDLLKRYSNGRGLSVELTYASAVQQRNVDLESKADAQSRVPALESDPGNAELAEPPGPDPALPSVDDEVYWSEGQVLASQTVSGPSLTIPATTTYKYAHPRRCKQHKSHLGFRLVEETHPDGSRTETYYYQKHGRTGQLAKQTLFDSNGNPRHYREAVWKLPNPTTVAGGWATPEGWQGTSASDFEVAYIGRIASEMSRNEYGEVVNDDPGSEFSVTYTYDDSSNSGGFNFISEIEVASPGRATVTKRTRAPLDSPNHLVRRVATEVVESVHETPVRTLASTTYLYQDFDWQNSFTKPGRIGRLDQKRDNPDGSRNLWTGFKYDSFGNMIERQDYGDDPYSQTPRITRYYYDGDPACSGCDSGQGSRSIIVGVENGNSMWSFIKPHDIFGSPIETWSDYLDVPHLRTELDSLGRAVATFRAPHGSVPEVKLSVNEYVDFPSSGFSYEGSFLPYVIDHQYALAGEVGEVVSIAVGNGAGGSLMSIELLGDTEASNVPAVATYVTRNPVTRTTTTRARFSCGAADLPGLAIANCVTASASADTTFVVATDTLGRPVRVDSPRGFDVYAYSGTTLDSGSGVVPHDLIFHKNPIGGLTQTAMAGGLPVRIYECALGVDNPTELNPELSSLGGVACTTPDESRLYYEPTGELRSREDPTVAAGGGTASDNQRLAYSYDTLGRIVRIDDPDAGTSTQTYSAFGELETSTDARNVTVTNTYDNLGRIDLVTIPGEDSTDYIYASNLLQVSQVIDGDLEKRYVYDHMGRVWRQTWTVDGINMMVDTERDYLDRPTKISYPTVLNGAIDAVGYEYNGNLLDRVCDIGVDGGTCASAEASPIVTSVTYDEIGRANQIGLPGGDRNFAYVQNLGLKTLDEFDSIAGPSEDVRFVYETDMQPDPEPAYDQLGNLTRVDASIGNAESYVMDYVFDARNRLFEWNHDGTKHDYRYDSRGNLVVRAGEDQSFSSSETAHAIRTRTVDPGGANEATTTYTYDPAGNLEEKIRPGSDTVVHRFDGRGQLTCVGLVNYPCTNLEVFYNGVGDRVKEVGSHTYLYAGPSFRLRSTGSGLEYWIEIHALGQRVAYKHVTGGAIRVVGVLPSVELPPWAIGMLWALVYMTCSGLTVVALIAVARSSSPLRVGTTIGMVGIVSIIPVQVWAGGGISNPHGDGTGMLRWVMSDSIGSGLVEIDASGQWVSHVAFEPFGRTAEEISEVGANPRSYYAGHDRQLDTGLVYMNARWMDAESGRFMSVDPLVRSASDPQTYNGYSYVENNPLSFADPTGMIRGAGMGLGWTPIGGGGGGGGWVKKHTQTTKIVAIDPVTGAQSVLAEDTFEYVTIHGRIESLSHVGTNANSPGPSKAATDTAQSGGYQTFEQTGGVLGSSFEEWTVTAYPGSDGDGGGDGIGRALLGLIPFYDAGAAFLAGNYGAAAGYAAFDVATIFVPAARIAKLSKVAKAVKVRKLGQFTIKKKTVPGRGPGQSRAEIVSVRNADGKVIRTYKDSFDRAGKFQHRKPLRGGPEGRPQ